MKAKSRARPATTSDLDPDQRVHDLRWSHQRRLRRQKIWERFCRTAEAPELINHSDYKSAALRLKNATRSTPRSTSFWRGERAWIGGADERRRRPCARSTPSTRCSPIRRLSISASRKA